MAVLNYSQVMKKYGTKNYSELRKKMQAEGEAPEWFTTGGAQLFFEKYSWEGETVKSRLKSIAKDLARKAPTTYPTWWNVDAYCAGKTWEEVFFQVMWDGFISCSTPLLANGGLTERGTSVSCAGSAVGDDLYSRYDIVTESAILTKHSHGTSCSVDDWAYKGKPLPRGGFGGGVMPLIRDLITCMDEVVQGSRRGSLSYALSIEHPEWYDVLNYLYKNPESNNPAWLIKDDFVNKLESINPQDYVDALTRLGKAVEVKMMRGKGYFTKIDEMNRHLAQAFKDAGMTVKASNLCVAPETLILTRNGYEAISELVGQQVEVWNGSEWSEVTVVKTGENQKLVTVKTDFGYELDCTEYHRFMVIGEDGKPHIKRAFELKAGDKLSKFDLPVIAGGAELENAYTNGFHTGDGTMAGGTQVTYLYGEKVKLLEHIEDVKKVVDERYRVRITHNGNLKDKFFVPDSKYTVQSRLDWLAGILDSDGCVARNGTNESFQLVSVDQNFLKEVQLMLQTLGVTSKVVHHLDAGMKSMPLNDGTGEYGEFQCKDAYRLLISSTGLFKLSLLGLKTNRLVWSERKPQRCAERFITVSEVLDNGRYDDTYCATEPKRNMLMFNGLNTMNCQETNLAADEDHTFSCVILNWNLDHYREAMDKCPHIGFIAHVMQDCNVSVYIEAIKKRKQEGKRDAKALEKILRFTEKFRAVGTGVLGLHTLFQKESIVVGSIESFQLNNKIFKYLDQETLAASKWLAQELGCPEGTKHLGIRNATRMMMPPTKSTAEFMAGASEGIGLDVAMVYTKQSAGGELVRVNKVLLPIMKERGVFNEATLMDLSMKKGSVQHVDWLTDHEKAVFRTAFEIDMEAHLKLCSQRQQYIDQGQSINLYFTSNDSHEYIMDIHRKALLDPNILTLYYVYSMRGSGEIKRVEGCEVCT